MPVSAGQLAWLIDQLAELGPVTSRRMFGGAGLYLEGRIFGIVFDDVAYFKADDATRPDFGRRGCEPFRPFPDKPSMSYFAVPDDVLDDPVELAAWARKAAAAGATKRR